MGRGTSTGIRQHFRKRVIIIIQFRDDEESDWGGSNQDPRLLFLLDILALGFHPQCQFTASIMPRT